MQEKIFKKIWKYKVITSFVIIDIVAIVVMIVFSILNWTSLASMISTFAALFSSLIALLIPLNMKYLERIEKKENVISLRKKGFKAFSDLCDYSILHFDIQRGVPKDNIEVINRTNMISQVQTIYTYRKELFPIGIIISKGWKDIKGDHNIFIHTIEELDIQITAHDFGKIRKIELKYRGEFVNNITQIQEPLEQIKSRIET